jgi:hypothetical protein
MVAGLSRQLTLVPDLPAGDESDDDFVAWVSRSHERRGPLPRAPRTPEGDLIITRKSGAVFVLPDNQRDP